ncbi:MAG: signal peptidase I [Thermodesulfobacteriota bacterium]
MKKQQGQNKENEATARSSGTSSWRENVEAVLIAVLLALFIRTFVVQAFKIPSGSMKDTLLIGDHILVNKFAYGIDIPFLHISLIKGEPPRRGDIIVFKYPGNPDKDYIKRVVAVAGDVVSVRDKQLYVNQQPMQEKYIIHTDTAVQPVRDDFGPVQVPDHQLFVMGDNRDNSSDSRFWGFLDLEAVRGKAFLIYWSWNGESESLAGRVRWSRIGNVVK